MRLYVPLGQYRTTRLPDLDPQGTQCSPEWVSPRSESCESINPHHNLVQITLFNQICILDPWHILGIHESLLVIRHIGCLLTCWLPEIRGGMLARREREVEKVVEGDLATLVWSQLWYAKV